MKLLQVIVGVALPLLAFLLFVFDDGRPELVVRVLIVAAGVGQAVITYRTVKSAAQARAAKKVEMNDQLSPLAYKLARIPAAGGLRDRRTAVASFLTKTVATCVSLTDEERSRATFYEVIEEAGARVFVPSESSGRGDPAKSRFREGDGADGTSYGPRRSRASRRSSRTGGRILPSTSTAPGRTGSTSRSSRFPSSLTRDLSAC